jgi:hypothetical protein
MMIIQFLVTCIVVVARSYTLRLYSVFPQTQVYNRNGLLSRSSRSMEKPRLFGKNLNATPYILQVPPFSSSSVDSGLLNESEVIPGTRG